MNEPRLSKVTITLFWLSLLGAWMVLLVTKHWGLGLMPESIVYVQAAKNFVSGQGLSVFSGTGAFLPLTHFPPLFPFVLSWGWFLGMDAFTWARFLNAALFGVSIFLAGMLAFTYSRKLSSAVLAAVLLGSVHIFETQVMLLSEPLLLAEALGFFLAFALFLNSKTRGAFYVAASFAAASGLTHAIGIILILSGGAAFQVLSSGEKGERSRRAFFFTVLALFPATLWFVCKQIYGAPAAAGAYRLHWPPLENVYVSINTVSSWLLPVRVPDGVRWAVLGLVIGVALALVRRNRSVARQRSSQAMLAPVWFLGTFLLASVIKGLSVVGTEALSHRGLVLVYVILFILLATNWYGLWRLESLSVIVRRVMFAGLIVFLGLTVLRSAQFGAAFYKHGVGYTSKAWAESLVVKNIRALDNVPVYTNDPEAFYYLTGRPAVMIPGSDQRSAYFPAAEKVSDDFNNSRAIAVIFLPSEDKRKFLAQAISVVQLTRFMGDNVADIYGVKRKR